MTLETAQEVAQRTKDANPTVVYYIIENRFSVLGKWYTTYFVTTEEAWNALPEKNPNCSIWHIL